MLAAVRGNQNSAAKPTCVDVVTVVVDATQCSGYTACLRLPGSAPINRVQDGAFLTYDPPLRAAARDIIQPSCRYTFLLLPVLAPVGGAQNDAQVSNGDQKRVAPAKRIQGALRSA